jgi:hypothetical protein
MTWYYTISTTHTRVRIFMNGALCGNICFRNEEFLQVMERYRDLELYKACTKPVKDSLINFINETPS